MFDVLLRQGTVIDGTGRPRFVADVALKDDRIAAVGDLSHASAADEYDIRGRCIAPGFIDVHNHTDGWLFKEPRMDAKVRQGFTTEVLMSDGLGYAPVDEGTAREWLFYLRSLNGLRINEYRGWQTLQQFQDCLDQRCLQNFMVQVPYANVRTLVAGFGSKPPDDLQRKLIHAEIRRGMDEGATGLSTGLDYIVQCHASTDELVDAARAIAERRGLYVTHVRYKLGLMDGLKEAVEIGRRAGVKVHISHMKPLVPEDVDRLLTFVDQYARHEVDFSFEVYPYMPGSTMLNFLLPYEVWEQGPTAVLKRLTDPEIQRRTRRAIANYRLPLNRIHIAWVATAENKVWQGATLADYVADQAVAPEEALLDLLLEERLAVLLVFHDGDDRHVGPLLRHDLSMVGSDGIYFPDGVVHPRVTGTAPRVLGPVVRDWKALTLEEAVLKLAGRPAERFGVPDRGVVAAGKVADLVVFDPDTVCDQGTYADPHQAPVGIHSVYIGGQQVWNDGPVTRSPAIALPGRALQFSPSL